MEKGLLAIVFTILISLSTVTFASSLGNNNYPQNSIESFINLLMNAQSNLISGLATADAYKLSARQENYLIENIECSGSSLRTFVKSESVYDRYLVFTVKTSIVTKKIFTKQLSLHGTSSWFNVNAGVTCSDVNTVNVNGYSIEDTVRVVYANSHIPYALGPEFVTSELQTSMGQTTHHDVSGSITYVYLGDKMIEMLNMSTEIFSHSDHLGSIRLTTDTSGNKISENSYTPFGTEQSNYGVTNNLKFTGKEEDSSGLYYYGARYYDPGFGRFSQNDPIYKSHESPYVYADNNPIIKNDPTGKASSCPTCPDATATRSQKADDLVRTQGMFSAHSEDDFYKWQLENEEPVLGMMPSPLGLGTTIAKIWQLGVVSYRTYAGGKLTYQLFDPLTKEEKEKEKEWLSMAGGEMYKSYYAAPDTSLLSKRRVSVTIDEMSFFTKKEVGDARKDIEEWKQELREKRFSQNFMVFIGSLIIPAKPGVSTVRAYEWAGRRTVSQTSSYGARGGTFKEQLWREVKISRDRAKAETWQQKLALWAKRISGD